MTAFDPSLDPAQASTDGPWGDSHEQAMFRHDIDAALHGVIGGLSQIDPDTLPAAVREQVDRVAASAKTLARLVGALTGDADGGDDGQGPVDLQRFLRHMRRRYVGEARERGLDFEVEAGAALPAGLRLCPVSLVRILDNLIGNALRYADGGTVRLAVAVDEAGGVVFRVHDEGPGFGRAAARREGRGLGLRIVHALADRLGGAVTVGDRPGGGVEAVLRFPAPVAVGWTAPVAPARDLAGLRILLAEDNPTNQMVATQMLQALSAEVTVCSDGVEALERFETVPVDLVVVDIEMPRMSGLDVIRAIRGRGDGRARVPIVALTAYAMREHRERILAAGANGLISKPVTSVEALGHGLAAHLALARADAGTEPLPRAPAPARPDDVIDLATYAALCEAIGPELMAELLDKVVSDLRGAQRDLAGAVEPLDRSAIRSASHILISVAGALGAGRLQGEARALNGGCLGAAPASLVPAVRHCMTEIDHAVAFARDRRAAL